MWLSSNNNLFNGKKDKINTSNTISKATEYFVLTKNAFTKRTHQITIKWEPPRRGSYTLNTDGTAKGNPGIGGIGRVFRNHNGDWIIGFVENIIHTTNTSAELKALLKGLQLAEQNNLVPLDINTDSAEIIQMLITSNLTYDPIICECRSLICRMDRAVVKHTYREQNRVTDALAKEATKTTFLNRSSILAVPSMFANDAFWADILGTDFVRIFVGCATMALNNNDPLENMPMGDVDVEDDQVEEPILLAPDAPKDRNLQSQAAPEHSCQWPT
ncbi:PREDICTED: uncharacterized protein LOC109215953 [Nicotiana attenuata]|uniref:uncharacterized protein LOC109215953 n=1 Tax=Nicotiana attenuata TaxID=49451 RepID=UPI0009050841|nr:PREDICTED: uncharacterized protein LOC109215953 [Nicotiana attenuata]